MAKGNIQGSLGPIMLALLIALALFVIYAMQDPELASEIGNERLRDPDYAKARLEWAIYFGTFALIAGALYKLFRK
ncbi:hypothetical protein [Altererythrobacter sp. MF3-039]|uniref:hypothetical protein n=1 Tax=Altererythrobacter sp. MF3-039 TaxID=3252901 RepID=UPI00390C96F9